MRRWTVIWFAAACAAAVGLFVIKHQVRGLESRLASLQAALARNHDAVRVLEAEWAYLNTPARLESLGRRLLALAPPDPGQIAGLGALALLPPRTPEPPPSGPPSPGAAPAPTLAAAPGPPPRKPAAPPLSDRAWIAGVLAGLQGDRR